ncbi:alpha/beta hydrolase [Nevskia sp.]|uniref:alpha/beta hydrolase n=1 Tax=Nevskia sp. TaxID=1929292 RepID=UPI003F6F69DE
MISKSRFDRRGGRAAAAVLALLMIAFAAHRLADATRGLRISHLQVADMPVTIYAPDRDEPAPTVVIAHGFAGSQQLMQPLATTLARAGFLAITFDFPGHGRHPRPLASGLADQQAMSTALVEALRTVVAMARKRPESDGRLALLGHSMASDVVVRLGIEDPSIAATIAVSLFFPRATDRLPHNLLIIDGAFEAGELIRQGLASIRTAAGGQPEAGPIYGQFDNGSARRLVLARGAEHIGVLYARDTLDAAVDWLSGSFLQPVTGHWRDLRGGPLALLFGGLMLLAWALAARLPVLRNPPDGLALPHRALLLDAGLPAIVTPLLLWPLPHDWLPLLLGGYLAMHFALYGLLVALMLRRRGLPLPRLRLIDRRTLAVLLTVTTACAAAFGYALDHWVASVAPHALRWPLIAVMTAGLLPYFVIDEWITRGPQPAPGGYLLTKLLLLVSLLLAVALNPYELFFLVIIVPVVLLLFVVFGSFSRWIGRRTGQPLIAAVANAVLFGWLIAVSFPVVGH